MLILLLLLMFEGPVKTDEGSPGTYVQALWWLQSCGSPDTFHQDRAAKTALAKALAHDKTISLEEVKQFMSPSNFQRAAGDDKVLSASELEQAVNANTPKSRERLNAQLRRHLDYLTITFDMVEADHVDRATKLGDWIAANYRADRPLHVIVVCTGNSRRSILSSSLGNAAASYYGLPELHFHSGGTAPTAFNKRTVASLQAIGFEIQSSGHEAERGEPKTANPIYTVQWGEGLQTDEFSKHYGNPANPSANFAAVMVCSEADAECPIVKGASLRLSMPFLDPKSYDDSQFESAKYAERRDDIGRTLLSALGQAARRIAESAPSVR